MSAQREEAMCAVYASVDTHEIKWKGMCCVSTLVTGINLYTRGIKQSSKDVQEGLSPRGTD